MTFQPLPIILRHPGPSFSTPTHEKSPDIVKVIPPPSIAELKSEFDKTREESNEDFTKNVTFSSYTKSSTGEASGPNPGEFPIITLIDEPSPSYYQPVFQNNIRISSNPYYAPEEFNYNQDPIDISHSDKNTGDSQAEDDHPYATIENANTFEINVPVNQAKDEDEHVNATIPTVFKVAYQESRPPQKDAKIVKINQEDIPDQTISDDLKKSEEATPHLGSLVDCGDLKNHTGFCSMTSLYPTERIKSLIRSCSRIVEAFAAFVPENFDSLGDNSIHVIESEKDPERPWSWKVYAYKKRQICDSELLFIRPSYGLDTQG